MLRLPQNRTDVSPGTQALAYTQVKKEIVALGITWILDGFEMTLLDTIVSVFTESVRSPGFSVPQMGLAGSTYVAAGLPVACAVYREGGQW